MLCFLYGPVEPGRYAARELKMKSLILILVFVFGAPVCAQEVAELKALNDKVSLQVPNSFSPMSKEILEAKYPASRRPTEVLSDSTGGVSIAFNHTKNRMTPDQIDERHKSISKMFHNLYPSAKWLRDETITQNGRKFMVLELVTPAIDTKIHNIMYGTSLDGRFLLVAFNTTEEQAEEWLPVGKQIMKSIKIKE